MLPKLAQSNKTSELYSLVISNPANVNSLEAGKIVAAKKETVKRER